MTPILHAGAGLANFPIRMPVVHLPFTDLMVGRHLPFLLCARSYRLQ